MNIVTSILHTQASDELKIKVDEELKQESQELEMEEILKYESKRPIISGNGPQDSKVS